MSNIDIHNIKWVCPECGWSTNLDDFTLTTFPMCHCCQKVFEWEILLPEQKFNKANKLYRLEISKGLNYAA